MTVQREDVEFAVAGEVTLRGWLFRPGAGPHPGITMAHGYAGVREHGLERYARAFAAAGFVVLLHDHRGFGHSDGEPRYDVDPWRQIADWRRAISYLESRPEVDPERIGLWGTSYAGGHAIVLGATDRRLRAVVAQVPTISGYQQSLRRVPPDQVPAQEASFIDDDRRQFRGEPPDIQAVVSSDPGVPASYRSQDAIDFYSQPVPESVWENLVTVRSTRAARMYEPGTWIERVSPTPLMLIVGLNDAIKLADVALAAYERALQPKKLVTIAGGHFDPYLKRFDDSKRRRPRLVHRTPHLAPGQPGDITHLKELVLERKIVMSEYLHEASVARLRDGSPVLLRRLDAADIDAVISLHDALSDHERYLRFFTMHPAYLKTLARKLTERSDKDYALGAFESGELIGVANYVACHDAATAEVAVVVAHNDHLRGVGTALLRRLSHIARSNAIQHLVADVLVENQLMRNVLRDAGWHAASNDGNVLHVDIDLANVA